MSSLFDLHGLITRELVLIKKGDASPFKDYNFNQNLFLPPSLEELIAPNHPVRVVNQVVDNLNLDPILAKYEGGGCTVI